MIPDTLAALTVPIASLTEYEGNPRRGNLDAIRQSLEHHGQYRPVVVRTQTREVLAGNHTLRAARELGWQEIAATFVDVDDQQAKQIVLTDNRTNDLASYDDAALVELLQSLPSLDGTGFDDRALRVLIAATEQRGRDTEPREPPAKPTTRPGQLACLGEHRLLCGDATVAADVAHLLGASEPQLMATDPPYGVGYEPAWRNDAFGEAGRSTGTVSNDNRADWCEAFELFAGSVAYVWHAGVHAGVVSESLVASGFEVRCQIVWAKQHFAISRGHYHVQHEPCWYAVRVGATAHWAGDRSQSTLWSVNNGLSQGGGQDDEKTNHGTQKPVELFERTLANHDIGDVYDPFVGSGTTLIAAENLGRRAFCMEIDPGYCDVVIDRWQRHTGQKAKRANG
jgi:DNA modification methylase